MANTVFVRALFARRSFRVHDDFVGRLSSKPFSRFQMLYQRCLSHRRTLGFYVSREPSDPILSVQRFLRI